MANPNSNTEASLRRVFIEGFVARDLAEPLLSFDIQTDVSVVRNSLANRRLGIIGIRENGRVAGFVESDQLDDRGLDEQIQELNQAKIVTIETAFQEIVCGLSESSFLLVSALDEPMGVITRDDLEKAPMRMWLFGMVSLFEMMVTRIVREHYVDESWMEFVSESRIAKARQLQDERSRRSQSVELMDCLQLGDKGQLFARSAELRSQYWDRSRNRIDKVVKKLERLRNNLAHSQHIISENWETMVMLSEAMDTLFVVRGKLEGKAGSLGPPSQP